VSLLLTVITRDISLTSCILETTLKPREGLICLYASTYFRNALSDIQAHGSAVCYAIESSAFFYFVPRSADNIGILDPSSSSFTTIDISNTISSDHKYKGGVLGPNGRAFQCRQHWRT